MDPRQSVVLATLISFLVFVLAGDEAARKTTNGINRLSGGSITPTPASESGPKLTTQRAAGWAGTFLFLIILADVPATSELGASFAWLLLVGSLLAFGPDAFRNVNKVLGAPAPATGTGGGGGARRP